ncbi:TPA: hypothetical protein ACF9NR_001160 [Enterobacter cloacae]
MAEQKVKLTDLPAATDTVDTAQLLINQNSTDQKLAVTHFLRAKNNFSELTNVSQARANLDVPSVDEVNDKLTGFIDGANTFLAGASLASRSDFIWDEESKSWYYWKGTLPKDVPAASNPASTGGVGDNAWGEVGSDSLRDILLSNSGASLIGTSNGDTVQQALDDINNTIPQLPYDYYIGSFFASNTNDSLSLFSSHDGKTFTKINANGLTPINTSVVGNRDPSIIFYKNFWYVAATTGGTSNVGSTDADFLIFKSKDLITWQLFKCLAGPTLLKGQPGSVIGGTITTISPIWAPSLSIVNGDLYVQLNIGYKPQAVDIDGNLVNWCAPFACKCNNLTAMTFDFPQQIMTDTSVQRIDVEMSQNPAGGWVLAIKNEYNKHIEVWKSNSYLGGYTKVADLDFGGVYVEGPSLVWINGLQKWRMYADAFRLFGTTYYVESVDLVTWTSPIVVQCPWPLRHGTVTNLANLPQAEKAIQSFSQAAALMLSNNVMPCWEEGGTLVSGSQTIIPKCNYVYRVGGSTQSTVTINQRGGDWFYLLVASGLPAAGITVTGTAVDGTFSVGYGQSSLRVFKIWFNQASGLYEVEGQPNQRGDSAAFSAQTGWPTITTTFTPMHGRTYTTSGGDSSNTTISGLPSSMPDGTYFHLWIGSETATGSITITTGATNIQVGSSNVVLAGNTGNGNRLYTMKKVSGTWRLYGF